MIAAMPSRDYERFAGTCALLVAAVGLAYSLTFVIGLAEESEAVNVLKALFLLAGGLLSVAVLLAVYGRLREVDPAFALLAFVLGLAGGLGAAIHGAEDLALEVRSEDSFDTGLAAVDPRGFLTFGVSGLALLLVAWLVRRGGFFPARLGGLSALAGALLVFVYVGRLTIYDPENAVLLIAAALVGFAVNPALYAWLGVILRRGTA
jgi:hypothetical protein